MPRQVAATVLIALALAVPASAAGPKEVDPFIGTTGQGNTLPGPRLPFGFAYPSPDTTCDSPSGYCAGAEITGFSQTHVSGTGGHMYGNLRLVPLAPSAPDFAPQSSSAAWERAAPGRYAVYLSRSGTRVDLAATRLAGLARFRLARGRQAGLRLELTSRTREQRPIASSVRASGRRAEGSVRMRGGWNGADYRLFFSLAFDRRPGSVALWVNGARHGGRGFRAGAADTALVARFDTRRRRALTAKIGLSFISVRRARRNAREARGFGLAATQRAAERAWRRALAPIFVGGGSRSRRRAFATALYHAQLMPSNLSGENAWWRSRQPHYEDLFALWDGFRTQHPLLALVAPRRERDIVRSLLDTWRHTGWLPDARGAGRSGWVQVGSNAVVVIADALTKKLPGITRGDSLRAVRKDADVQSPRPFLFGRELTDYKRLGYVPFPARASAARTLEYSYEDFAASEVATAARRPALARRWLGRSLSWRRLWDPASRSVRPRDAAGRFLEPFDPGFYWPGNADPFYEGSAGEYSTFVPHDVNGLVARVGGRQAFVSWLDEVMRDRFHAGNEPGMLAPYLFIHACRQDLTASWVHRVLASSYNSGRAGLPGNDDAGALSAWLIWSSLGLYPNAGQPFYYLGSPSFPAARIRLPGGRSFRISAPGASDSSPYVAAARLNGRSLRRGFITQRELVRGGRLSLRVSSAPAGLPCEKLPPSL
jgi:predicted alpha-1,2-mannosidase